MLIELWMGRRDVDNPENNVEDTSGYEKSEVRLAWLGWEDLGSVILHLRMELVTAVLGMVNSQGHKILLSLGFSWWFPQSPPISLFLILNIPII